MSASLDQPAARERTFAQNVRAVLVIAAIQTAYYTIMNRIQWFPARTLPLTWLDETIPFLPWTVVPYMLLLFVGGAVPVLLIRWNATLQRALVAYALCVLATLPIFLFWPTHCQRPDLATLPATWDGTAFRWLAAMDTPACAFPSLHIILPAIACWVALVERHRYAVPFTLTAAVLSLTILTTKQHYVWDWLGGLAIAVVALWLSGRLCPESSRPAPHDAAASRGA